ncbi:phospholipase A and acyltransferase 4-like [Branchiostoma floridae x Branchiostoma japonicum]
MSFLDALFSASSSSSMPRRTGGRRIPSDPRSKNQDVLSRCKEGDLLEFTRQEGFAHWAVYVGGGRVIHRMDSGIREDSFWDIVGRSLAKINNYLDGEKQVPPGRVIVERARSKLGAVDYDLVSKNCEHFVTWCRYGEERSQQVRNVVAATAVVAGKALVNHWFG